MLSYLPGLELRVEGLGSLELRVEGLGERNASDPKPSTLNPKP